jgi:hypothetical protein
VNIAFLSLANSLEILVKVFAATPPRSGHIDVTKICSHYWAVDIERLVGMAQGAPLRRHFFTQVILFVTSLSFVVGTVRIRQL